MLTQLSQIPQPLQSGLLALAAVATAAALVLLFLGVRGTLLLDDPRCSSCGYDLTQPGKRVAQCPECGSDLGLPGRIRCARRARRPRLVYAGLALLLVQAVAGVGTVAWTRRAAQQAAAGAAATIGAPREQDLLEAMSARALIDALPEQIDSHLYWGELERRLDGGSLSKVDAERLVDAMGALATALEADSGGGIPELAWGGTFLDKFSRSGLVSDDRVCAFAAALGGKPCLSIPEKVPVGAPVDLGWVPRLRMHLVRTVARTTEVRVDGVPVPVEAEGGAGRRRRAASTTTVEPFATEGVHSIEVDVEWLVLRTVSGVQPPDRDLWAIADDAEALRAAGCYARRSATLKHSVEVVGQGVPLVVPVVDPELRASMRSAITVKKAEVSRRPVGTTLTLELVIDCSAPPIDLTMILRPVVEIGGHRLIARPFSARATSTSRSRSGQTTWQLEVPALGDDVRSLRLTLEPVLDDVRLSKGHQRAWGEAIVFDEVQIERRDLRTPAGP